MFLAFLFAIADALPACAPSASPVGGVVYLNATSTSLTNYTFDYVIVGGGTAGLTMANRLSANTDLRVAVIEAGGFYEDSMPDYQIPGNYYLDVGPMKSEGVDLNTDWGFLTTPQPDGNNRMARYTRGKTLGGCSARNGIVYQRPTTQSMEMWATAVDDESFTLGSLMPLFEKSSHYTPANNVTRYSNATVPNEPGVVGNNSDSSGVQVSFANYAEPSSTWYAQALGELGIPEISGFNTGKLIGRQWCTLTIDPNNQTRSTSQTGYLTPAYNRSNLFVLANTLALKIDFDSNKTATGVQVQGHDNVQYTLKANHEVILTAGAFQSPQMLMVSGVGPEQVLQQFNIPVVANLPGVGQNMTDHIEYGPTYQLGIPTLSTLQENGSVSLQNQMMLYAKNRTGTFTVAGTDYLAWEKLPQAIRQNFSSSTLDTLAAAPADWPEFEYEAVPNYFAETPPPNIDALEAQGQNFGTIYADLVLPYSRGNLSISSNSMLDQPIINPYWLSSPVDQELVVGAFKRMRQAFETPSLSSLVIGQEVVPGPSVSTDEQILQWVMQTFIPVWHASVTCRMGVASDPNAVVDNKFNVFGVQKVKVVDASSFALLPPGHPQSLIYALAEKAADGILSSL